MLDGWTDWRERNTELFKSNAHDIDLAPNSNDGWPTPCRRLKVVSNLPQIRLFVALLK